MYGNNWARHLAPAPEEFRELWQEYRQNLKAAGIVLKRERSQGWIGIWYYYAKGENPDAVSAPTEESPPSVSVTLQDCRGQDTGFCGTIPAAPPAH